MGHTGTLAGPSDNTHTGSTKSGPTGTVGL